MMKISKLEVCCESVFGEAEAAAEWEAGGGEVLAASI